MSGQSGGEDNARVNTPAVLEEISRASALAGRARSVRRGPRMAVVMAIVLLLVTAIGALLWRQWTLQQDMAELAQRTERFSDRLQALSADRSGMREQLTVELREQLSADMTERLNQELDARITVDEQAVARLREQLRSDIDRLGQRVTVMDERMDDLQIRDQQWRSLDAVYLLRQAQRRLQFDRDADGARTLLEQAQGLLAGVQGSTAAALRESIDSDLAALGEVEMVDRDALYRELERLGGEVGDLSLLESRRAAYSEGVASAWEQTMQSGERDFGESLLELLASIFAWRERSEAPVVALGPEQVSIVRQNLQLMLEQAQLSLLRGDGERWRSSLQQARDWHERYFATGSSRARRVGETLDSLAARSLATDLPALNESMALGRQLLAGEEQ